MSVGSLTGVPEPPPVTGISELVLEVSDLEAARRFYRDLLGFEETRYGEGRDDRVWYLIGSSARLGLWTPQVGLAGGRGGAHVHFAFQLPRDELEPLLERLRAERRRGRGADPARRRPGDLRHATPTATWSSSGPRTWPSTAAGASEGGGPGTFAATRPSPRYLPAFA